jgi:hypothetical protein
MFVSRFYAIFVWNISHSKNWTRRDQKYVLVITYSTRYSCHIVMRLEFSRQIFEKFHENSSSGSRVVPRERTDGQTWRIVAFRSFSKVPKHWATISCLAWTQTGNYSVTVPLTCSGILWYTLKDLESLLCLSPEDGNRIAFRNIYRK